MRDRRWDFLYDLEKEPVRDVVVRKFSEELARELAAWPPPFTDWVSEEERLRWAAGVEARPRGEVLRLALALARLDLEREYPALDERMRNEVPALCRNPAERASLHLLVFFVTERCLALKEWAEGARLTRADLSRSVERAERLLFPATPG